MPLVITTPATADPVTLAEAKEQLRETGTDHDPLIARLVDTATAYIEGVTSARLGAQVVDLVLDCFPAGDIDLSVYPVTAINSIAYDDADGASQTFTDYTEQLGGLYPVISPVTVWPGTLPGKPGAVVISIDVGYVTVPQDIKHAVLMEIERQFTPDTFEGDIMRLLQPHRRLNL